MNSRQLPFSHPLWRAIGSAGAVAILLLMTGCGQKGPLYRTETVPDYVGSSSANDDGKKKPSPFSRPAPQIQKHDQAKDTAPQPNDTASDSNGATPESPQPPGN